MMKNSSVKIEYGNLYVSSYAVGEGEIKLPINNIPQMEEADAEHIHGYLSITIGGEKLGNMGFFGEDDVCFNEWIGVLRGIIRCFSKFSHARYLFCDMDQGSPAFEFCRADDLMYVSHISQENYLSLVGAESFDSGAPKPEGRYICDYKEFESSARTFLRQLKKHILLEIGDFGAIWWEQNDGIEGECSNIKKIDPFKAYKKKIKLLRKDFAQNK